MMKLHEVVAVKATNEDQVFLATVDITDIHAQRYVTEYTSRLGDAFGLAPAIRAGIDQWIADGKPIQPHNQPSPNENEIDEERDRRVSAGFAFAGIRYQTRPDDRENIAGAATAALGAMLAGVELGDLRWHGGDSDFVWIAEDNTQVPMDAQTMFAFGQAAMMHKQALILAARALKDMNPIPVDFVDNRYWP